MISSLAASKKCIYSLTTLSDASGILWYSHDNGLTWAQTILIMDAFYRCKIVANGLIVLIFNNPPSPDNQKFKIWRSTDGGVLFTESVSFDYALMPVGTVPFDASVISARTSGNSFYIMPGSFSGPVPAVTNNLGLTGYYGTYDTRYHYLAYLVSRNLGTTWKLELTPIKIDASPLGAYQDIDVATFVVDAPIVTASDDEVDQITVDWS